MKVYTTLNTLSEAWTILRELGLSDMVTGKQAVFDSEALLNKMLAERKLQEFLSCITHEDPEVCGELGVEEALGLIKDFFVSTGNALTALPGLVVETGIKPAAPAGSRKGK